MLHVTINGKMNTLFMTKEVTVLLAGLPSLQNIRPNFKNIWVLHCLFEKLLQCLPCPQNTLHGWKGLVMAHPLYALIKQNPFRLPNDPGPNAVYIRPMPLVSVLNADGDVVPDNMVLTRTKMATIND